MEAASATLPLEAHRRELTAYCYRMLGSPFDAEDAVQDTLLRAWRASDGFEGRAAVRTWLYRIATNVCIDMANGRERRARPMELGPPRPGDVVSGGQLPEVRWLEPVPEQLVADPAELAQSRETLRLAFVAALQHLPPRQRAALILCEVLRWKAAEAAELLEMSVASVNSALQRARATLDALDIDAGETATDLSPEQRALLDRFVDAFERYDMDDLAQLIKDDARQSMPPYEMWLAGRDSIFEFWQGPGHECRGSKVLPAGRANGSPAFGQYKRDPAGGYTPWALQVLEVEGDRIGELTFFLSMERVFPLFGLPPRLDADGRPMSRDA